MRARIVLIGNPVAGGGALRQIRRAETLLRGKGCSVEVHLTAQRGDAEVFARRASDQPETLVVAAGGDGTYNEVANGLIHSPTPMAILPLGTTSVLAHELGLSQDIGRAVDVALNGTVRPIHLGRVTLRPPQPPVFHRDQSTPHQAAPVTRHFLLMAGIGFDGETIFGINEKIKRYTGKGAYIMSGLKALIRYAPSPLTLTIHGPAEQIKTASGALSETRDEKTLRLTGYSAIVGKASCYGGSFKVTPDARITDPHLYIFLTHGGRRTDLIRYVIGIISGRHLAFRDVSYVKAREAKVEGPAHVQIDGDYAGTTPAQIDVVPRALTLVFSR